MINTDNDKDNVHDKLFELHSFNKMDRYEIKKIVGEGSFGRAILCRDKQKLENVIVKEINISEQSPDVRQASLTEAKILSAIRHPNIVGFIDSFTENGKLYIVMEYAEGGDLWAFIKKREGKHIPEEQIITWMRELVTALNFVHSNKILHRDIKSQNIFLDSAKTAKLGDFGIAKVLEHTCDFAKTIVGSPFYLSPEICSGVPYDFKTDIWSLGCVFYEMCTLTPAFSGNNMGNVVMKILQQKQEPIPSLYSEELANIIDSMLQKDPNDRPSLPKILSYELLLPKRDKIPKVKISPPNQVKMELNFSEEPKKNTIKRTNTQSSLATNPRKSACPQRTTKGKDKISSCLMIQPLNHGGKKDDDEEEDELMKVVKIENTQCNLQQKKARKDGILPNKKVPKAKAVKMEPNQLCKKQENSKKIRDYLEKTIGKGKMIKAYNDLKEDIIDERDVLDYIGGRGNEHLIVLLRKLILFEDELEFICEKIF